MINNPNQPQGKGQNKGRVDRQGQPMPKIPTDPNRHGRIISQPVQQPESAFKKALPYLIASGSTGIGLGGAGLLGLLT